MNKINTCKYGSDCVSLWSKLELSVEEFGKACESCEECMHYAAKTKPDFTEHTGEGPWIN